MPTTQPHVAPESTFPRPVPATGPVRSQLLHNRAVARVLPDYIAELPAEVAQLQAYLNEANWKELRRLAHTLRGSGGGYGFPNLTTLASEVEGAIDTGKDPEEITDKLNHLIAFIRRIENYDQSKEVVEA